jgi:hypothetical protein
MGRAGYALEGEMEEIDLVGTYDTEETANEVSRAMNAWFDWLLEGDPENVPELFEDFGIATDDFALDRESDIDWPDPPVARANGNRVVIRVETAETVDTIQEVMEALGAYDVWQAGDEDSES